ncbi:MAG: 2,3-bisphosphoglycerate-independent phosphoglycerate mutase [Clostridia bacterium]
MRTPITLIIMDGFGLAPVGAGTAIRAAATPNIDKIFKDNPNCRLNASGLDVGLPDGQMGNSEVGHTNIGAGRVVFQELPRITKSIKDGDFFNNEALLGAVKNCKEHNSALHIMGLMSDGGVHSHNTHFWGLLELAKRNNIEKVFIHCFMDGRDVSPTSGADFIAECMEKCKEIGVGEIATIVGRYYAMDRDNRWERVVRAYDALVMGEGAQTSDPVGAIRASYAADVTDEFLEPIICSKGTISENDSVIFANFRPDRAREITRAFVDPKFDGFSRKKGFFPLHFVCMTQYDLSMPNVYVAFRPQSLKNTFGEYISRLGYKQLRIAETEKYAHVTFFFNGGVETLYDGEERVLVDSPKVATYDLQPEMSAPEVTDKVTELIESQKYDVVILNFANCDMVGHTGIFEAAKSAVETVDTCVGRVVEATRSVGGISVITADHGNADQMLENDGVSPFTAHTTNQVPLVIVGAQVCLKDGRLADIAPTLLDLMGINPPSEMDGKSLIIG